MTSNDNPIRKEYFEWLYNYVCIGRAHANVSYKRLFNLLHNINFKYLIKNDVNRAVDGIDLRYRFSLDVNDENVMKYLKGYPCSVLEMIIGLAIRCEETIMEDPRYGDRTKQWFWSMLSNLGLSYMTDDMFDEEYAIRRINIFLNREYDSDGKGGLFYIRNANDDLRNVEIWTQLCWYLNNID